MNRYSAKTVFLIAAFWVSILTSSAAFGKWDSHPRAVGMGGAYSALARDFEAPEWNPANLGLSDGSRASVNIISGGFTVNNNSFTVSDYIKYNGEFLDESDKDKILASIPASGLAVDLSAEVSALDLSIGNIAFTYGVHGSSSFFIDRDPIKLLLLGNAVTHEATLSSTRGEAIALADLAASWGHVVRRWAGGELAVGGTLHYLQGLEYSKVVESVGGVSTTEGGFEGSGHLTLHSSHGGVGYSADAGLAARFGDGWRFSVSWRNAISRLYWGKRNEERILSFEMQPVTLEQSSQDPDRDSPVSTKDSSYSYGSFSSRLAPVIRLGIAKSCRKTTWSVDWEQALIEGPCQGVSPGVAVGLEYVPRSFLPLRAGLAFGGDRQPRFSGGFGIHSGPYEFDMGAAKAETPLPVDTRGLTVAFSFSLRF